LSAASSCSLQTTGATSLYPSECAKANAAQIITVDATVHQVIGVPAPPGFIAVMPKYAPCRGPSPWRARAPLQGSESLRAPGS